MGKLTAEIFWKPITEYTLTEKFLGIKGREGSSMKMVYFVIAVLFLTCCKAKENDASIGDDVSMWLNRHYPTITGNNVWEGIPLFEIKEEYRDAYIEKLNDEKYVVLSSDDFYLLTGQILEKKYGLAVRGIVHHPGGELRASKNYKNDLSITSYMSKLSATEICVNKKAVVIVEVDEMPEEIFNNLPTANMVFQPPKLKQRGDANDEVKYTGPVIIKGGTCTDPAPGLQGKAAQE
jgi:hypothetical protein